MTQGFTAQLKVMTDNQLAAILPPAAKDNINLSKVEGLPYFYGPNLSLIAVPLQAFN